jgi:DNA polymerase III sliding clamp (beta) subunit (PCNA family)
MITQAKKLELISKHAKKFAAKKDSYRPILEGVHYAQGGSVFITDAYCALRIRNAHSFPESTTSHAVTGASIDGPYPSLDKVFPTNFKLEFNLYQTLKEIQIYETLQRTKWAWEIAKSTQKKPLIQINIEKSNAVIEVKDNFIEYRALFGYVDTPETYKLTLNAEYLLNALNLFKDAGTSVLSFKLRSNTEPIVLSDEANEIDIIIMPVRVYD